MANQIDLVTKFLPLLDEVYRAEAKSSILEADPALVRETEEANVVKRISPKFLRFIKLCLEWGDAVT